jgi:N-acetylneuraminic acid mutarotase
MTLRGLRVAAALGAASLLLAGACSSDTCKTGAKCAARPGGTATNAAGKPPPKHAANKWYRIPSPPGGARQEVAATVVGGKIYVAGGLVAKGSTARVEAFDPKTFAWSSVASLPDKINHAMAAELGGRLYVFGGFSDGLKGRASKRVFVLKDGKWSDAPPLTEPRAAGAAVTIRNRIVVVGGIADGKHLERTEIFDGSSWRTGGVFPVERDHLAAASDGKLLYAFGGRANGKLDYRNAHSYDPNIPYWGPLAALPTGRSGLGAAYVNGSVVAVGGEGPRIFPEVEAYNIKRAKWSRLPAMGVPRHGVGVVAIGTTLYSLLGGSKVGLAPSAVCEAIDLR